MLEREVAEDRRLLEREVQMRGHGVQLYERSVMRFGHRGKTVGKMCGQRLPALQIKNWATAGLRDQWRHGAERIVPPRHPPREDKQLRARLGKPLHQSQADSVKYVMSCRCHPALRV